ncbi:hypothetical protein GRF29_96g447621 [Pseudopithomyces chartarum]|uniref:Uncharacterized protein n=1 Tax=Pseudopithomyces chartarum TaxID=1892770 RepID=A0AAN6LUD7_9PLEO|nr:hypothetical protein GRF29_96g447621 [Pseudopithomyces chartarum]
MPAFAIPNAAGAFDAASLAIRNPNAQPNPNPAYSPYDDAIARSLASRDIVQGIIPTYYRNDGPGTGAVVGIVLGSVAGFILLTWLLYSLTNSSRNRISAEEEIVVRRPRRNSTSHRSRRGSRSEVREVREYDRSPRRSGGRSAVIVEERRTTRPRSIVVDERSRSRVPGDDVVEVIEEHDEYRERRARRSGGYR